MKGKDSRLRSPQIPAQPGKDTKLIHSIASLIRAKSKLLVLENPDTVEIYKVRVRAILKMDAKIIIVKKYKNNSFLDSIHFKKSLHGSHRKTWHYAPPPLL